MKETMKIFYFSFFSHELLTKHSRCVIYPDVQTSFSVFSFGIIHLTLQVGHFVHRLVLHFLSLLSKHYK